jgi:hypothetical protein
MNTLKTETYKYDLLKQIKLFNERIMCVVNLENFQQCVAISSRVY